MGLKLPVIWLLKILCIIAVILPGSSGSVIQSSDSSLTINSLPVHQTISGLPPSPSLSESTAPPPEHDFIASTPGQPIYESTPPPFEDTPHVLAPHGQQYESTPPHSAEPLHNSPPPYESTPLLVVEPLHESQPPSGEPPRILAPSRVEQPYELGIPPVAVPLCDSPSPSEKAPHVLAPPVAVQAPHEQPYESIPPPVAKPLHDSPPPFGEAPHVLTPPLAAEAPHELPYESSPPPVVEPLPDSRSPYGEAPHVLAPRLTEQPYESSPPHVVAPPLVVEAPHKQPYESSPPLVAVPLHDSPPPFVEAPHVFAPPLVAEAPHEQPYESSPPPVVEPFHNSPPPFTEAPHVFAPPLVVEAPHEQRYESTPPFVAEPLHDSPPLAGEAPHVSDRPLAAKAPHEPPYESTPPPVAEQLPDSTPPLISNPPPPVAQMPNPPVPSSVPGKAAAAPSHLESQPFLLSPPPATPNVSPALPFPSTPPEPPLVPTQLAPPRASPLPYIAPSQNSSPPPPMLIHPVGQSPLVASSPPTAEPAPPHSSALPLAAKPPNVVSPPPVDSTVPPPLEAQPVLPSQPPNVVSPPLVDSTVPPPLETQPILPSQPPSLPLNPPHPFPMLSPPTSPYKSSPPSQQAPLHASPPNFEPPSRALAPPPLVMPLPQEPPPPPFIASSPPIAKPPPFFASSPHVAEPPPFSASTPPITEPPPFSASTPPITEQPPFSASSPPITEPPPFSTSSPPIAEPPHTSSMPNPAIPRHNSSPLPQLVPLQTSPTTTFAPPPLVRPSPTLSAPQPIESPHKFPPPLPSIPRVVSPNATSPPHFVTPYASSPPLVMPSPSLVPPPGMEPPHAFSAPPPSSHLHSSVPTPISPSMQGKMSPAPPQRQETQFGAPPLLSASPDAPVPKNHPINSGVPLVAPAHSSSEDLPPNHAPSKPKFERQNVTTRAPLMSQVHPPPSIGPLNSSHHSPLKGSAPSMAPSIQTPSMPSSFAPLPAVVSPSSTTSDGSHSPASSPKHLHPKYKAQSPGLIPDLDPAPPPSQQGQAESPNAVYAPMPLPTSRRKHHPPPPPSQGRPVADVPTRSPPGIPEISPASSPLSRAPSGLSVLPFLSPKISPSGSSTRNSERSHTPPIRALPPPPPNQDCAYLTCPEPLTNTPPGSPCGCVWPMQVGLRLSVPLYTFFPLVTELAREIAAGVFMKQSQVRVMGANAASQSSEKTIVLVNLVPLNNKFDNVTALLTFRRFWRKQVAIDKSIFGDYDILYVHYQGLPPSPPMAPADIAVINGMPYSVGDPNGSKMHPLGVEVPKQNDKRRLNGGIIAVIVFSATFGVLICFAVAWILIYRHTNHDSRKAQATHAIASFARSSGPTGHSTGSGPGSSLSFGSSLTPYTGTAKTFSLDEIERATDNFNPTRILGEGGFGLVYGGTLEDETNIAVKVLKRDDQQGSREFLAEVEMLSRLHHRNLVKLIGICIDDRTRCLIYELVPNGSVESHLHGTDKETTPLDWPSRVKIALGAARGLAYLHEDSSPRVIHRDFKSSNILLENNFTPKVSDFGLARTAMDEENRHISTRVMGTFGYVAPEYAMTGHLLVKSDVYSYGVVLLELLTGRKPVDMSQPSGQENLVAWTRPLLTSKEGLESIIDPLLGPNVQFESVAKVAAIASMCVQPEVSHRPFMGEVVQALKLVCNECDDSRDGDSRSHSRENFLIDFDAKVAQFPDEPPDFPRDVDDVEKGLSVSEVFAMSGSSDRQGTSSLRRHSASGPMRTKKGPQFWQKMRRMSQGSMSEHGIMQRLWTDSH